MKIDEIEDYKDQMYKILNMFKETEEALETHNPSKTILDFLREDLCAFETFESIRKDIEKIDVPKKPYAKKNEIFNDKMVVFLYSNFIPFCITNKVKSVPLPRKFISNVIGVLRSQRCIHHSK